MCTGEDLDDSNTLRTGRVFYLKAKKKSLTANQKWEISFKIIDSRKFWVVRTIKVIIDSYNGQDLQFSLSLNQFFSYILLGFF